MVSSRNVGTIAFLSFGCYHLERRVRCPHSKGSESRTSPGVKPIQCSNHPNQRTDDLCDFCAKPFCTECLTVKTNWRYCPSCIQTQMKTGPQKSERARDALLMAILSLFCAGQFLGPFAFYKAVKAKKEIEADPSLTGGGIAVMAMVVAVFGFAGWLVASIYVVI